MRRPLSTGTVSTLNTPLEYILYVSRRRDIEISVGNTLAGWLLTPGTSRNFLWSVTCELKKRIQPPTSKQARPFPTSGIWYLHRRRTEIKFCRKTHPRQQHRKAPGRPTSPPPPPPQRLLPFAARLVITYQIIMLLENSSLTTPP